MRPDEILRQGAEILAPVLTPQGFVFRVNDDGVGSGGAFAVGEFARDARRLEFHFQWSLGLVTYHEGAAWLEHAPYLRALGVRPGDHRYPRTVSDPLDAFADLAHDVAAYGQEFLGEHPRVLLAAAATAAEQRQAEARVARAKDAGDERKRQEAREALRRRDFGRVLELLETVSDPELLTASERSALALARRRGS